MSLRRFGLLSMTLSRSITQDTPELFSTECRSTILLPLVVERSEQDESSRVGRKGALKRADGSFLVIRGRNCIFVGLAAAWPTTFGDDHLLSTTSRGDIASLLRHETTGVTRLNGSIEESVTVGGNIVGFLAEGWVVHICHKGVHSDNFTIVSGGLKERSSSLDGVVD